MDIENMQAFVSVAELRSLTEAAQKLNHLQSNMTAKIKKLEAHYGTALFYRKPRGMELTPAGETLYAQFKQMLLLWQDTEMKMRPQEEKLRIGTMQSIVAGETTRALTKVYELYPQASVTLKTGTTTEMERLILDGELDIAFVTGYPANPYIHYQKICREELVLVGKGIHEGSDLKQVLQGASIIILSDGCLYLTYLEKMYQDMQLTHGEVVEVGVFDTMVQFSLMGMGITLMSKKLARQFKVTSYLPAPPTFGYMDTYLITRPNHEMTAIEHKFIEIKNTI
ncbi:LysR family transcriptional regulator [Paenibacillus polymyxa]|uniref:LysR family transcriptional regulator n=1 Tax=Paenibacillus polymyxa TaxID=1406 RepID=UPI0006C201CD|nr:LysR family transcriptional regulator [Paenibacillus polymyxa]KOS04056.1 transcriptional regulator [Paenibacillus polymyxa]